MPPNSVMVRVNGQQLEPNDGEDVREHVINMLKERPVTFDVVTFDELIELLRKLPNPPKGAATE